MTAVWIPGIRGCQEVLSRLTAVCCMLLPHNPYRSPQHYKRHFCDPPVAANIGIFIFNFWALLLSDLYRYNIPLTTFLVKKEFLLRRPVLIFNPQWTPEQAVIKACSVKTISGSLEKCAVTKCLHLYRCLWKGLGVGGGTFWLFNESSTFKCPDA